MIRCDATHCTLDSTSLTFDLLGESVSDITFDSSLTTFDSSAMTFDAATGGGVPQPAPAPAKAPAKRSRRYRVIEDPDKIQEEIRVEEKKVEREKKRLVILTKRAAAPNVEGALYQQIQHKVEKLEAKIDERMERLALLIASLDMDDEDDEEMFLLS